MTAIRRLGEAVARDHDPRRRALISGVAVALMSISVPSAVRAAGHDRGRAPNWTPRGYAVWDSKLGKTVLFREPVGAFAWRENGWASRTSHDGPSGNRDVAVTPNAIPDPGCSCATECTYVGTQCGCYCTPYVGCEDVYECVGCNCARYTKVVGGCLSDRCQICDPYTGNCNA